MRWKVALLATPRVTAVYGGIEGALSARGGKRSAPRQAPWKGGAAARVMNRAAPSPRVLTREGQPSQRAVGGAARDDISVGLLCAQRHDWCHAQQADEGAGLEACVGWVGAGGPWGRGGALRWGARLPTGRRRRGAASRLRKRRQEGLPDAVRGFGARRARHERAGWAGAPPRARRGAPFCATWPISLISTY